MSKRVKLTQRILGMLLIPVMCIGILLNPITSQAARSYPYPCVVEGSYEENAVYSLHDTVEIKFKAIRSATFEKEKFRVDIYSTVYGNLVASVTGDYSVPNDTEEEITVLWNTKGFPEGYYEILVSCLVDKENTGEYRSYPSTTAKWKICLAEKGRWIKDSVGWWYQRPDGSYPYNEWAHINNVWYYFNSAGYMVTGWNYIGGHWYYMDASGAMRTGWLLDRGTWYYLKDSGAMAIGWQFDNGEWYYLSGSGAMVANQWVGNYYLLSDGRMAKNMWIGNYLVGPDGAWIPDGIWRPVFPYR